MKARVLSFLSIFTSIIATLCWTGGLILSLLGLGAVGSAYFSNMTKYKPLFVILTIGMLYWSYSIIEKKKTNKTTKIIFWIAAIVSITIMYLPNILNLLKVKLWPPDKDIFLNWQS